MSKKASTIPAVDLVIVIDTSPSMKDEAQALSDATAGALANAKSSCPTDLRVVWLGIEGTWKGTNFDTSIRGYLTQKLKVGESKLRERKRGELSDAGAQEDAARAIEDISDYFDWRSGATRAIFYLGDEALEGGGDKTEPKDIIAANVAIQKAQAVGVTVHTYFGTSKSKHVEGIKSEYARVATATGGQYFTAVDVSSGFSGVLEKVICGSRTAKTIKLKPGSVYIQDFVANECSKLYTLDLTTRIATLIGEVVTEVSDIAFVGSQLYGLDREGDKTKLVKIDLITGDAILIGDTGHACAGLSYNFQRQKLYATTAKQLIALDIETGKGTAIVTVADQNYNCGEIAFDADGRAYITLIGYDKKKLLALCNLETKKVDVIGNTGFPDLASMEFVGSELYGVTGNFFKLGKDGQLIRINTETGRGTLVGVTDPLRRWAGMSIYEPARNVTTLSTPVVNTEQTSVSTKKETVSTSVVSAEQKSVSTRKETVSTPVVSAEQKSVSTKKETVSTPVVSAEQKSVSTKKETVSTPVVKSEQKSVSTSSEKTDKVTPSVETTESKTIQEQGMSILTIDTKNNCYVIAPDQMNHLQQNVANSFTLEKGSFEIKIAKGSYSFASAKTGEPFVLLWIYGLNGNTFTNQTTGLEVGATWTTLNGYNDSFKLQVKNKVVLCALFFDINNNENSGSIDLLITSSKQFFNPLTLTVDSKRNCYVLDENQLSSVKQENTNFIELNPGNYRLKITSGDATYWSDNKQFDIEPWALIRIKGGKFITKLTGVEVEETWCSLNGLKDEVILEVQEKTTLLGLFVDTFKEDNSGQIIISVESVAAAELAQHKKKQPKHETTTTTTTTTTVINTGRTGESGSRESVSREAVGASSSMQFTFHFNEDEFKKKWEEQLQQINTSMSVVQQGEVTLEAKYWDQLEQWLLKSYEKHFKSLAIEVAKVRFSMDAYTQQMEFSLNQQLQNWSGYLDRLLEDRINVEITKKINQQINQQIDASLEQKIRNNVELIINNVVNKPELNSYIERHVDRQLDSSFEQKIRNNIGLIINNIVNKPELNSYIDRHVTSQIDSLFEQKVRNNVEVIINNLVNKPQLNQYIDQHVTRQIDSSLEQTVRNNINLITQNIVNDNTDLNQYVNQQIDLTYSQKIQNNLSEITRHIVTDNEQLNSYVDQRLQQTVINNTAVHNSIVNVVVNSNEINAKLDHLRNDWNQSFISLATQHADQLINTIISTETFNSAVTQKIINNNAQINQYVNEQIDNSYEQKIQNNLNLITRHIVNNNEPLNAYIDQRSEQTVINNPAVNQAILNLVVNSSEINSKIENLRNDWHQTFIPLAKQHVDQLIDTIISTETFNSAVTQKIVNNNAQLNQYVNEQIDNSYEQKIQNNLNMITRHIVNNNEELSQYIDQRVQQTVINNTTVNDSIVNLVTNSTEINSKIDHLRNEWNQTFTSLATQHVEQLLEIISGTQTFNSIMTQKIVNNNPELNQYISEQIDNSYEQKIQNNLNLITRNIVNNNEELSQYIDQRLQQTVINNKTVNNEIVNLVTNSTEINGKIDHLRNEWNQTFTSLLTQHVDQLIEIISGAQTFNRIMTQKIVNNNPEFNQYVSEQIDNSYEQKIQNNLNLITRNIVNNNEELSNYIDQRLQQTVIHNTAVNNEIVNLVTNSTEINNKINNVYRDIDVKIENVRNEWNRTFISLVTQHVEQLVRILGDTDTFNIQIANSVNIKVDELLSQIVRIKSEMTAIMNTADRHLYEWTLGELMAIKGCLTDRQVLVEQIVTFTTELRGKLDSTNCVDINSFQPFKPLSLEQKQPSFVKSQQLPGS